MPNLKENLHGASLRIREFLCAYHSSGEFDSDLHFCDCKYGADRIGRHSEQGSGCPEMADIAAILDGLTLREIHRAIERGIDKRNRRIKKKRRLAKSAP